MIQNNDSSNPLVSVVVPCFNHQSYVANCINSIIDQDYINIELIIIDDGSSDNSVEEIEKFINSCKKRFIRFEFRKRENRGLCKTLNEGIHWSRGYFVTIIASDDIMYPNKISLQVNKYLCLKADHGNLCGIYSGVEYIDKYGRTIKFKKGNGKISGFKEVISRDVFLPTPTFMCERELINSVGGFNEKYKLEDFYIRLKLADAGFVFYVLPNILVKYRKHGENLSSKSDLIWEEVRNILFEYKDRKDYSVMLAKSMMVQAHDYQQKDKLIGVKFLIRAISKYPLVIFSVSTMKFVIKLFRKKTYV